MFQSPQWGDNYKVVAEDMTPQQKAGFSPRIGGRKWYGVPFTHKSMSLHKRLSAFRLSPHWESNSKVQNNESDYLEQSFQSPQRGSSSKDFFRKQLTK